MASSYELETVSKSTNRAIVGIFDNTVHDIAPRVVGLVPYAAILEELHAIDFLGHGRLRDLINHDAWWRPHDLVFIIERFVESPAAVLVGAALKEDG